MTHTRFNIRPAALVLALLVSGASSLLSASAAAAPKPTSDGKTNIWASAVPKPIHLGCASPTRRCGVRRF